jgi:hypothetical protein
VKTIEDVLYADLTDAPDSVRVAASHALDCGCEDCSWVEFIQEDPEAAASFIQAYEALEREHAYVPPPALRVMTTRYPELGWLCYAPPEQRAWHLDPARLSRLLGLYPHVGDAVWRAILR